MAFSVFFGIEIGVRWLRDSGAEQERAICIDDTLQNLEAKVKAYLEDLGI